MRNKAKKILIVDENDACRESLGVSIKGLGYEVFEAATGPEAIDKASSMHPDLIMMDLHLPEMNGAEATAHLKTNPSTRDIPVLIITAYIAGIDTRRALDAGAEEILYKPLGFNNVAQCSAPIFTSELGRRFMNEFLLLAVIIIYFAISYRRV
jgi:two-component system cell cycle response regulator DivK